ncbi:MAG: hypothetical protein SAK29_42690 [Scytonema sp. PMC 1069.18]|nr:hypothetical protein [Scytonema sp. PMC 1069.18]MEC4880959.1 hypothetical protein [Scytonema sp. PMC 1070.18]
MAVSPQAGGSVDTFLRHFWDYNQLCASLGRSQDKDQRRFRALYISGYILATAPVL